MAVVPAMVADLATAAQQHLAQNAQLPSMMRLLVGAGGMPPAVVKQCRLLFPQATIHTAYGMTEACSSMTFATLSSAARQERQVAAAHHGVCVGRPPAGIDMAVLHHAQQSSPGPGSPSASSPAGNGYLMHSSSVTSNSKRATSMPTVSANGNGEILTRGPHTLMCYWSQPEETAQTVLPGGWLRTGDLGWIDSTGQVWLTGRMKDTIRTGGETVHASEVEAVLLKHPAVKQAAVFGMPHARLGEQVTAVVVLNDGWEWTGQLLLHQQGKKGQQSHLESSQQHIGSLDLQQHCRMQQLSPYKLPRLLLVSMQALPVNASGKIQKQVLKQWLCDNAANPKL